MTQMAEAVACPPHGAAPAAACWDIEVLTQPADLARLGPEWDALHARAGRPSQVFQTWGFIDLFARAHGFVGAGSAGCSDNGCGCSLAIVVARRAGRLGLVWPLALRRQLGLRVLEGLGEPIAQYSDALLDVDAPALPLLQAAYAEIVRVLAPDVVRLRRVRADSSISPLLDGLGVSPAHTTASPCVTLAAGGSAFEERQSSKARKNRRRLMRRLEEQGTVSFEAVAGTQEAAEIVAAGLAQKRQWLVRRGLVSPALADARLDAFMAAAVGAGGASTGGIAFALRLDSRPVAVALGFQCKRRLMLHLIAHTAEVERQGAGVLTLEAILRHAEAAGLEAVDLLPPRTDYKLEWSDTGVTVGDHVWGLTGRGRLLARVLDGHVRPGAKRVIEGLPMPLRQRLAAHALQGIATHRD